MAATRTRSVELLEARGEGARKASAVAACCCSARRSLPASACHLTPCRRRSASAPPPASQSRPPPAPSAAGTRSTGVRGKSTGRQREAAAGWSITSATVSLPRTSTSSSSPGLHVIPFVHISFFFGVATVIFSSSGCFSVDFRACAFRLSERSLAPRLRVLVPLGRAAARVVGARRVASCCRASSRSTAAAHPAAR